MRYTLISILCLLSALPFGVSAKTNVDIFHTEVPMPAEKNAQSIAWGQGLEQVLIKASGNKSIASNSIIKKALNNGSDYLSQFNNSTLNGEQSMVMDFNSEQVQSLLSQANALYWPESRENVLVWLVDDDGSERQIGWEQSGLESVGDLQAASNQSGLPITLPLGDMDDLTTISATDLWGSFADPLSKASQRYPSDAVLLLKVEREGQQVQLTWQLYDIAPEKIASNPEAALTGTESGTVAEAIDSAIAKVSLYYAKQNKLALNQEPDDSLQAHFSGISNAKDFFALERMLKSFNSVASVQVHRIQGDSIDFSVQLFTSVEDFEKEAAKKRGIAQTEAPTVSQDDLTSSPEADITSADKVEPVNDDNQVWFDLK
ncbi:DUF2066 domain-containing protein [Vibrio rumoiensis]|uniref:DUF2066 domain-containing protein n=1 Tax=Vibrio rumoiensis 1S-45 TaxID=1188252 RepID=A0A1E5E0L5_9VIBR|nr:DUF2066 domain-containing protein [Vibrio rumoiensis]OEF23969.1 hypothetical protein A1QC_02130 [Vibrio rumoiensis 1S-45]